MKLNVKPMVAALTLLAGLTGHAQAQATTDSLAGWESFGDVVAAGGAITMTTAFTDGSSDGDQPYNLSGAPAYDVTFDKLYEKAGVDIAAFDIQDQFAVEGSLITQSFASLAGETLSFDWSFASHEETFLDHAFVIVDGQVFTLATTAQPGIGTQSYSYTFAHSGPVTLSFGVVDTESSFGVSSLSVSNLQLVSAVPEPATTALMLVGLVLVGAATRRARRRASNASDGLITP